jgi:hypothetical protein
LQKRHPLFKPGDMVRVRSREEVGVLLDSFSKTDGCLFMPRMWRSCDRHFKIVKIVDDIYDEYRAEMCRTRIPLYILEGAICDGDMEELDLRCDRTCYYLWHENWLEKSS